MQRVNNTSVIILFWLSLQASAGLDANEALDSQLQGRWNQLAWRGDSVDASYQNHPNDMHAYKTYVNGHFDSIYYYDNGEMFVAYGGRYEIVGGRFELELSFEDGLMIQKGSLIKDRTKVNDPASFGDRSMLARTYRHTRSKTLSEAVEKGEEKEKGEARLIASPSISTN